MTNRIHHGRQSVVDRAFFIPHSSWQLAREYLDDGMKEKKCLVEKQNTRLTYNCAHLTLNNKKTGLTGATWGDGDGSNRGDRGGANSRREKN